MPLFISLLYQVAWLHPCLLDASAVYLITVVSGSLRAYRISARSTDRSIPKATMLVGEPICSDISMKLNLTPYPILPLECEVLDFRVF